MQTPAFAEQIDLLMGCQTWAWLRLCAQKPFHGTTIDHSSPMPFSLRVGLSRMSLSPPTAGHPASAIA